MLAKLLAREKKLEPGPGHYVESKAKNRRRNHCFLNFKPNDLNKDNPKEEKKMVARTRAATPGPDNARLRGDFFSVQPKTICFRSGTPFSFLGTIKSASRACISRPKSESGMRKSIEDIVKHTTANK